LGPGSFFSFGKSRSAEMPWGKVLNFTDPFPYQLAIRAADLELLPTARGEFRANLTQVCMTSFACSASTKISRWSA